MTYYRIEDNQFVQKPMAYPKELDVGRKHHRDRPHRKSQDHMTTANKRRNRKTSKERLRDRKKERHYRSERNLRKGERRWDDGAEGAR